MSAKKEHVVKFKGLSCADCSRQIEREIKKLDEIKEASLNFTTQKLKFRVEGQTRPESVLAKIKSRALSVEPGLEIESLPDHKFGVTADRKSNNRALRYKLTRIAAGSILFLAALLLNPGPQGELLLYSTAYLIIGHKVLFRTVSNIKKGRIFDENFLMTVATLGAFAIAEYPEGVAVMLFYELGETVKDAAVNKSRRSIKSLLDIKPGFAHVSRDGEVKTVNPEEVEVGEEIIVRPGEKVPVDGRVLEGEAMVNTAALTGESVPARKKPGDEILSGSINKNGLLTVKVEDEFKDSTVSRILELVENAADRKAETERFITKFARYYTPIVVLAALVIATLPPLLTGDSFTPWVYRALVFLVISCPCALVISIPLGFFGGIGAASRQGILIKGANFLEALNDLSTIALDKTGTITAGVFEVSEVSPAPGYNQKEVLKLAAGAELNSNHPIAEAIMEAAPQPDIEQSDIENFEELAGRGIKATIRGEEILAGSARLMREQGIDVMNSTPANTGVHIAVEGEYAGLIEISDRIKEDSPAAISELLNRGKEIIMLTGDDSQVAEEVAVRTGLQNYRSELLPDEKVSEIEDLLTDKTDESRLSFIGDGINDAPVLARADIGIAMGGLGSDAAIEAADVVLMNDRLSDINRALDIASFTRRIVIQNIALALGIKGLYLGLGALGIATMWGAVFADVGVALMAVLNATRIIRAGSS